MYKIIVTSKCKVTKEVEVTITEKAVNDSSYYDSWQETRYIEDLDEYELQELNGYTLEDNFVEFINNEKLHQKLLEGYLRLELQNDELVAIIEYKAVKRLSKAELEDLKNDTAGSLSDGLGECLEQELMYNKYYVSTWISNDLVTIKQTKLHK